MVSQDFTPENLPLFLFTQFGSRFSNSSCLFTWNAGDFESHVVPPSTSFWAELKRRNVPNVGEIAHAVVAWLIRSTKLRLPK